MVRSFTLMAIVASTLGGCHSPKELRAYARGEAIEYRGEMIRLTKRYDDFDTYKSDPNNIAPTEYDRVRKLVETAPVPERCADSDEVLAVTSALVFPGYGSGGIGEPHATVPLRVIGETIEIPHADADRFVIYLKDDHGYRLVDDTVLPELPNMADAVTVHDGKVTYLARDGATIAERPIRGHADR